MELQRCQQALQLLHIHLPNEQVVCDRLLLFLRLRSRPNDFFRLRHHWPHDPVPKDVSSAGVCGGGVSDRTGFERPLYSYRMNKNNVK